MKLVMTLVIKDEADIIGANIWYHLEQGIDFIVAIDHSSSDGTREILESYAAKNVLEIIDKDVDYFAQAAWVSELARRAYSVHSADWVINNDADEFWWPNEGSLKSVFEQIPQTYGICRVSRSNFAPSNDHTLPFYRSMILRERISFNHRGRPLPPKCCHRGVNDASVSDGNHAVHSEQLKGVWTTDILEIFHFPARNYLQFSRKIINHVQGRARYSKTPKSAGQDKKALYDLEQNGKLLEYFQEKLLVSNDVYLSHNEERFVIDRRLEQFLISRGYQTEII